MPLETPPAPIASENSELASSAANYTINDPEHYGAFFKRVEFQVAPVDRTETWDLEEPAKVFNPDNIAASAVNYAERPDYAAAPKTRTQELEESLAALTNPQLVQYAHDVARAVVMLRSMQQRVN